MVRKNAIRLLIAITCITLIALVASNTIINSFAVGKTFDSLSHVPKNKVGMILGTAKKIKGGGPNPYYDNRIAAIVSLYEAKKIEFILVSGDNGSIYYNEPTTIKNDLVKEGIPAEKIFLDYAGFRTLDSMVRAKEIFGLEQVTVVSQKFHNERAIYLAHKFGLRAIGFNAQDIDLESGLKVQLREYFARVKVFIDLALKTRPKFSGDEIKIE
ncbi:SanA/YdcF family protein [Maribacter cobaltidurans]|uniref:Protein SanA n=1 Tax=Maribacter cobaltidurans TaxID=1178778 RepID=A0A223VAZ5_9FLAO|nr:ElyC/SanA/YdcF family protein [Maribacter cobaltidurans]ASV32543.1 protein SanA [Maribacter cobaltidurans]GGD68878.1 protein SanA [Maribacter cobaltidurans]